MKNKIYPFFSGLTITYVTNKPKLLFDIIGN